MAATIESKLPAQYSGSIDSMPATARDNAAITTPTTATRLPHRTPSVRVSERSLIFFTLDVVILRPQKLSQQIPIQVP
jgi:hypothetical protein